MNKWAVKHTERDNLKNHYASVTRVLEATKTKKEADVLNAWKMRVGIEEADRIATDAKERGHIFHEHTEVYAEKGLSELPELNDYLNKFDDILLSESWIYHDKQYYKGRIDNLVVWNGQPVLLDWKTSLKPKRKTWMKRNAHQLGAYAKALESMFPELKIFCALIVIVYPDDEKRGNKDFFDGKLSFQEFQYKASDLKTYGNKFFRKVKKYQKLKANETGNENRGEGQGSHQSGDLPKVQNQLVLA